MNLFSAALAATLLIAPFQAAPSVMESRGNIYLTKDDGSRLVLTRLGLDSEPVLSPDGRSVAFVRTVGRATLEGEPDFTVLQIYDIETGSLSEYGSNPDNSLDLNTIRNPVYSLDGGFIYVEAPEYSTSNSVYQINIATRAMRKVIDGNQVRVLRTGRYRGYVLVWRHRYYPQGGSYEAAYVVRPDGNEMFEVLSARDDQAMLERWLAENQYQAW